MGWFLTQSALFILLPFILGAILGWAWWRFQHNKTKFSESSAVRTLTSDHETRMKERDDLITKLRTDNKKLTDDAGAARTQIQGLASSRDADVSKSEGELTKARARIAELEKANARLPELDKASARIAELEKANARLPELEKANARIGDLEAAAAKAGQVGGDFDKLQAAHTRLEADYEASTERAGELGARAEAAESEVARLKAELAAASAAAATPAAGIQGFVTQTDSGEDDLEIIEGVGPKFAAALRSDGLKTFRQVANSDESRLRGSLTKANLTFAPSLPTWAQQARYLADGDEENFRAYVQFLTAGREAGSEVGASGIQGLAGTAADDTEDDLERIEGIGPRFASALKAAGIKSFGRLAGSSSDDLRSAIEAAGLSFAPSIATWAEQASLLAKGDEDGFKALTDRLVAGRDAGEGR